MLSKWFTYHTMHGEIMSVFLTSFTSYIVTPCVCQKGTHPMSPQWPPEMGVWAPLMFARWLRDSVDVHFLKLLAGWKAGQTFQQVVRQISEKRRHEGKICYMLTVREQAYASLPFPSQTGCPRRPTLSVSPFLTCSGCSPGLLD